MSQTVFLALTDLRRQLGSPHSAISFVASIVFIGFLFWLLATFAIDHFLNAAFLWMPILILAPATASITADREAGYASILFTYPVTATRYYAAKFLALLLLVGVLFLLLIPFLFLIVIYGGSGWLGEIAKFAGWATLEATFVSALGLFLSASFGRRAAMASAYAGFGLGLVFIIGPWFTPSYIATMPPDTVSLFLRILHSSPLMAALDGTRTGYLLADNAWPSLVATVSVVVSLVALGLFVYRRLQSAEGWEVGRAQAAPVVILGVLIVLAVPMIPEVGYTTSPSGLGNSDCAQTSTVEYCLSLQVSPTNGGFQAATLGSPVGARITIYLRNGQPEDATVEKIILSWSSRFIDFNRTRAEFGPVQVPADSGSGGTPVTLPDVNLTAVPRAVPSLRLYEFFGFGQLAPVPLQLTADGISLSLSLAMNVGGPLYNRDIVWAVVVLEAALVLGRRLIRRPRKG